MNKRFFKEYRVLILSVAIAAVIIPVFIWMIYYIGGTVGGIPTDISAGNLLGYSGSIIGGVITFCVLYITLCNSERERDYSIKVTTFLSDRPLLEILDTTLDIGLSNNTSCMQKMKGSVNAKLEDPNAFISYHIRLKNAGTGKIKSFLYKEAAKAFEQNTYSLFRNEKTRDFEPDEIINYFITLKKSEMDNTGIRTEAEILYSNPTSIEFVYIQNVILEFQKLEDNKYVIAPPIISTQRWKQISPADRYIRL